MTINENRVREFAHQIWESEGRPHGQDQRHWEMACRRAEESEESTSQHPQQQQAAPQHRTVENNDTDIMNKPAKEKTRALKKTIAKNQADESSPTTSSPKTTRAKKAKLVKDVVDTELTHE